MTTDEVRALLALAESMDGRFSVRAWLDGEYAPTTAAYKRFLEGATPAVVAALCKRVLALEESMRRLGYDGI